MPPKVKSLRLQESAWVYPSEPADQNDKHGSHLLKGAPLRCIMISPKYAKARPNKALIQRAKHAEHKRAFELGVDTDMHHILKIHTPT